MDCKMPISGQPKTIVMAFRQSTAYTFSAEEFLTCASCEGEAPMM